MSGRIGLENESAPGAIGVAPELTSTYVGGADMPDRTPRPRPTPTERLWAKFERDENGCWIWTAAKFQATGYGQFRFEGRTRSAHKAAYELLVGPVPEGLHLDHLCCVRACINPSHLEPVTPRENLMRGDSPWARKAKATHCVHGHEFTEENTHRRGTTRECRACQKIRRAARTLADRRRRAA